MWYPSADLKEESVSVLERVLSSNDGDEPKPEFQMIKEETIHDIEKVTFDYSKTPHIRPSRD